MEAIACVECTKERKELHLRLRLTACKEKRKILFDVGNLDLETVGMDLLHCLCGSY